MKVAAILFATSPMLISALSLNMLTTTSRRVAVLGSGISGSSCARKLAEAGHMVTVFECGYGVGGRVSTRVTRDEYKFAFDHGAQYIGSPKTPEFQQALDEWQSKGFVREWDGVVRDDVDSGSKKRRYVGYPAMNSISENLLDHNNIDVVTQTRACATYDDNNSQWTLTSHGDRRHLGQFDWLIGSDRLSATNNRADLRNSPLQSFKDEVKDISSVPILVLMIAFEESLNVPYDGVTFEDGSGGSLGWIARDTSKPGRERSDNRECWVVQSNYEVASKLLETIDEDDFQKKREIVREKTKALLLSDFEDILPKLCPTVKKMPTIVSAVGHRWSAAFPSASESNKDKDVFVDDEHNFIGCGDYLGKLTGRIEGAFLTGSAAASSLINAVQECEKEIV